MATISDISQALGDYMLKGWVLTDQSCTTPGCTVPLVRSPKGRTPITTICVRCNRRSSPAVELPANPVALSSDASTESQHSRSSTPPTEFSEIPDSPTFIPLEESEQSRRRRAQSDQASSEIGKKLLQGWAMLGDECPNETCYGVPLVRPPKAGGQKDPRKECVICGNIYATEVDWAGRETLVPYHLKTLNDSKKQGDTAQTQPSQAPILNTAPSQHTFSSPLVPISKGKETNPPEPLRHHLTDAPSALSSSKTTLDETSQALQTSLRVLSGRLTSLASFSVIDPQTIGMTADAITKVTNAIAQVQQLQVTQNP